MTQQHGMEPLVRDWLHDTLDAIPESGDRLTSLATAVHGIPQRRAWLPLPGRPIAWSGARVVAAAMVIALFGAFLLSAYLVTPRVSDELPATVSDGSDFPLGTFVSEEDGRTLEFRADGTCLRAGVACTYGFEGTLFSEVSFEDATGRQMPATYYWDFDGQRLTFRPWGSDLRPERRETYTGHTYLLEGETQPMPATRSDFPTGDFVAVDDPGYLMTLREDGRWKFTHPAGSATGRYVVSGDLYTESMHNVPSTAQVPATYEWRWDGERLRFSPWGDDAEPGRRSFYVDHVFQKVPEPESTTRRLLLSDPRLDVWVTVELTEDAEGSYSASATVDGEPLGTGAGGTAEEAVRESLQRLGEPYASSMAASVGG